MSRLNQLQTRLERLKKDSAAISAALHQTESQLELAQACLNLTVGTRIEFKARSGVERAVVVGVDQPGDYDAVRYRVVASQGFTAKAVTIRACDVVEVYDVPA